ncbi:MAG: hypothetical protein ACE5NM_05410 [Sedimentisphaerales bacterium]
MEKLNFRVVVSKIVLILTISFSLLGCASPLKQQAQTVRVAPVSEQYKLAERLQGRVYVFLAETSTGQEQHKYAVSDSLARAIKEYSKVPTALLFLKFGDKTAEEIAFAENLELLSFTELANRLNEKNIAQRYAEMRDFYQRNGMFRKTDIEFLGKETEADYFILPCLLDIRRWGTSRFSIFGLKIINTQIIAVVVSMEIWDARTGHKVFSATSDVTIASERIRENPISIDEAFQSAWFGIIEQLPE